MKFDRLWKRDSNKTEFMLLQVYRRVQLKWMEKKSTSGTKLRNVLVVPEEIFLSSGFCLKASQACEILKRERGRTGDDTSIAQVCKEASTE